MSSSTATGARTGLLGRSAFVLPFASVLPFACVRLLVHTEHRCPLPTTKQSICPLKKDNNKTRSQQSRHATRALHTRLAPAQGVRETPLPACSGVVLRDLEGVSVFCFVLFHGSIPLAKNRSSVHTESAKNGRNPFDEAYTTETSAGTSAAVS